MKHKVRVNLVTRANRKEELLTNKTVRLPQRLVKLLFGDATQILIMQPGQSVQTVEFFELPSEETTVAR